MEIEPQDPQPQPGLNDLHVDDQQLEEDDDNEEDENSILFVVPDEEFEDQHEEFRNEERDEEEEEFHFQDHEFFNEQQNNQHEEYPTDEEGDNFDTLDYQELLEEFSRQWMLIELDHDVSNVAANCYWKLATTFLQKFFEARTSENISKKIPQFNHIRRTLHKEHVPPISLEIGYRNKESSEITVVNDTVTPRSRFQPDVYEKIYEIASIKVHVEIFLTLHFIFILNIFSSKK